MGRRKVEVLKKRVELERCIGREPKWTRLNNGGIQAGRFGIGRCCVGRCGTSRRSRTHQAGQLQELELSRILNLEKESSENLEWTHLE